MSDPEGDAPPIDPWLLEKLVCAARQALLSDAAGLAYPVRDGVPVLLVREAAPL